MENLAITECRNNNASGVSYSDFGGNENQDALEIWGNAQ